MDKIGIYLTDASYDKGTGVSSISFIEKTNNTTNNIQINTSSNILTSEFIGIKECLKHAFRKFKFVVVFCDNINAVNKAKKELFTTMKLNERFAFVQFVWLPREFMHEADFLTKNIEDIEKNKEKKLEGYKNKMKGNVLDIFISEEDKRNILKELINDFKKEVNVDNLNLESTTLINILIKDNFNTNILNDLEKVTEDIKHIIKDSPKQGQKNSNLQKIIETLYSI